MVLMTWVKIHHGTIKQNRNMRLILMYVCPQNIFITHDEREEKWNCVIVPGNQVYGCHGKKTSVICRRNE